MRIVNVARVLCLVFACAGFLHAASAESSALVSLTREECLLRVMEYNESVQIKEMEWRISQFKTKAEGAIFEPEFVGSYQHQKNFVLTTAQQRTSLGGSTNLDEINDLYSSGVDYLLPTGGKLHGGYSVQKLKNNFDFQYGLTRQYQTFGGMSLSQPLLKNAGVAATTSGIRLAAGASEVAFQDYRRQMMLILAQAEASYWDLYYFQELDRILEESVNTAKKVFDDNRVRRDAGKASDLEVMEAESGLAIREARRNDARHKLIQAMNRLVTFFSGADEFHRRSVRALDHPVLRDEPVDYSSSMWEALQNNPDYLSQRAQLAQSNIRVSFARNQRLPQLDLTASYGLNGLGSTFDTSSATMQTGHYETWSIGVELRIPLEGGIKSRNELLAARMRKEEALLGLKSTEVDLSTAMDTSVKRIEGLRDSVADYQKVVDFNQRLLDAELSRLEVGKTDSQRVLQTEEKLFEAKRAVQEVLVDYQKAFLEWEIGKGTLLRSRRVDFSQSQLKHRTLSSMVSMKMPMPQAERILVDAKKHYDKFNETLELAGAPRRTERTVSSVSATTPAEPGEQVLGSPPN